jgi:hypothetical protein
MTRLPVPLRLTERRLPQAGRIRLGVKDKSRQGRKAIDTFRFTSQDDALLAPVAAHYGGEVTNWHDPKSGDRYELVTETRRLNVVLPPDPLTEWFELWSGKLGLERRCDGEVCDMLSTGPDGGEIARVPCLCYRDGALKCTYKLRLSVMLPEVDTLSTWRLDTSSENARKEIPGVVDLIEMAQGRGLFNALLRLEQRTSPGQRFNVPVLDVGVSAEALIAGGARLGSLPPADTALRELAAGEAAGAVPPVPAASPSTDDDIEDAVVIDDVTGVHPVDPMLGRAFLDSLSGHQRTKALIRARKLALEMGEPVPANHASISTVLVDVLVGEYQNGGFPE